MLPSEEIPEDTPHYLNPKALKETDGVLDVAAEETTLEPFEEQSSADTGEKDPADSPEEDSGGLLAAQPPEKIEAAERVKEDMNFQCWIRG